MNTFGGKARASALLAALAAGLLAAPARAAFDDLGAGARAPGMGDAFTAVADDVYAIYYNPAGLALLEKPELAASRTQHLMGLSDGSGLGTSFLGYAQPLGRGNGALGAAVQSFSLDGGYYNERAYYLSYGRPVPRGLGLDGLYWGMSLKALNRSFGNLPESSNAYNGMSATGLADPVLSGNSSASAFDADLGLLYRLHENYSAGVELVHVPQPNVAFASGETDRVPMRAKLGLNYRSLLANVAAQYDAAQAPTGARDHRFTVALERWFPWLLVGNVGVRTSLSVGSRDFRQATAGLSYRTGRISVDYGFTMPINTITSTSGSHRLSFSIRFGAAKEEDESVQMVLEAMRAVKTGKAPDLRAAAGLPPAARAPVNEHLSRARFLESEARFPEAGEELSKAIQLSPEDEALLRHQSRLNFAAVHLGRLENYKTDAVQSALYRSALAYLNGSDAEAVNQAAYALNLRPGAKYINNFLVQLELTTGLKRRKAAMSPENAVKVEQLLTMASEAMEDSRYEEAVYLSTAVLKYQPDNIMSQENLGIVYFAMGKYQDSLKAWKKAYDLETSQARLAMIDSQIGAVERVIKQQQRRAAAAPRPAAPAPAAQPQRQALPPADVQKLYREGLDHYSAGDLEKARDAFRKVLDADPSNVSAANALKRVQEELRSRP